MKEAKLPTLIQGGLQHDFKVQEMMFDSLEM